MRAVGWAGKLPVDDYDAWVLAARKFPSVGAVAVVPATIVASLTTASASTALAHYHQVSPLLLPPVSLALLAALGGVTTLTTRWLLRLRALGQPDG